MSVTTSVRNSVYQRDNFQCIHCGSMKFLVLRQRSHTGNGSADNLVTLCIACNARTDNDQVFTALAMNHGWKLRHFEEPENRSVFYMKEGEWWYLNNRGTRTKDSETADG